MKLKAGMTADEKWQAKQVWHKWFAWHPVRVNNRERRWLEWVERRMDARIWDSRWEYRAIT